MALCSDDDCPTVGSSSCFAYRITEKQAGERLDQFLARNLPDTSRSQLTAAIRAGSVLVDGEVKKNGYRIKSGDDVAGEILAPTPSPDVRPERMELSILFEDEFLIMISKPPGLVVHPGSGNRTGTLVSGLLYHCESIAGVGESERPGIVHRLDKDTSGIMIIAKRGDVHRLLVDTFKARAVEKEYHALLYGILEPRHGRIVAPIGRHPVQRQKMAVREIGGRYAATNWQVEKEYSGRYCLARIGIETGRTHQIRVHMAYLGHPVTGDAVYGVRHQKRTFPRQMLHASRLRLRHPITGVKMDIAAPLWPDFLQVIEDLTGRTL